MLRSPRACSYDPVKSFAPIVELATGSLVLAVHPSVPVKSTRELIDYAKGKPGQVTYASPGRGTPQHLAMELFKLTAGVDLRHVPYTGSAGAVKDLVGGHVGAMFVPVHTVLPMAAENQVRLLALGSEKRSTLAPDVPTLAEEGVSGFEVDLWYALSAPAGTPKDIIDRYNKVVNEILASPDVTRPVRQARARAGRWFASAIGCAHREGSAPLGESGQGRRHLPGISAKNCFRVQSD